jgi:hypothetical protein
MTHTLDTAKRLLNTIIYDLRLFTEAEIASFHQRLSANPDEVLKEAKATEQERWKNYKQNNPYFQL